MTYRIHQTERGKEAVRMLVAFIEAVHGPINGLSVEESNYSSGSHGRPDVVFREYGIEVKRVELLVHNRFVDDGKHYYAHVNNLSIFHESWDALKEWCIAHGKRLILVVVITFGRQAPMFVGFSRGQIDALQQAQPHKKWFQLNAWQVLRQGHILKTPDFGDD